MAAPNNTATVDESGDVIPFVSTADVVNLTSGYPKLLSKFGSKILSPYVANKSLSDFANIIFGYSARPRFFTSRLSILLSGIPHVICICASKKMVWSDAQRIIAVMANKVFSIFENSSMENEGVTVCKNQFTFASKKSVVSVVSGSSPNPAIWSFNDSTPKISFNWSRSLCVTVMRTVLLVGLDFYKRFSTCWAVYWKISKVDSHCSFHCSTLTPFVYN